MTPTRSVATIPPRTSSAGRERAWPPVPPRSGADPRGPVESDLLADETGADLLVVNKGLSSLTGLLGSVPADAARRATCDVLIVHTT